MKISIVLCSLALAICISAAGQYQSPATPKTSPAGTPPTFPQHPDTSTTRDNFPPDTTAPKGSPTSTGPSAGTTPLGAQQTELQGCLNHSGSDFVLTSHAGILYQLQGDEAELARHVGEQVSLSGLASSVDGSSNSPASAPVDADSSESKSDTHPPTPLNAFTVGSVRKIADTCTAAKQ